MSAAPAVDGNGRPTGAEPISDVQTLTRRYSNSAGQLTHKDEYFNLAGLTYMGSSGLVAIHSIALLMRGQEPTSPEDGWQALHELGTATAGSGAPGVLLAGPPPSIERVLDRSGMLGLFPVLTDRDSAVAAATTG